MSLRETLTMMKREGEINENWVYDNNTSTLLILQSNLVSLLKASMIVTNNFSDLSQLDLIGLINGLVETLEWMQENIEMVRKDSNGQE